jgi:RimJ/RimL family protein N-acetyltransferase
MVRGRSGGVPNLIEYAEKALIEFCFETLQLQRVYLTVINTNPDVIEIHNRLGFRIISKQSLQMVVTDQNVTHSFVAPEIANVDYDCWVMSLKKADLVRN